MRIIAMTSVLLVTTASYAHAQSDPFDGQGDNSNKPDIWVAAPDPESGETGSVFAPGDNQPVIQNGNSLDFDTEFSPDSEIVVTE
ncbi:hypothetical protein [Shinella sp. BYT-45]|uniref:hypothetical protein n=1 Tax=Shinella sp. BYT-45 TaxID=3377377 RepID=UPI0039813615